MIAALYALFRLVKKVIPLEEVKCLEQRVSTGEPTPSGECPECGALTHPEPSQAAQADRACGVR